MCSTHFRKFLQHYLVLLFTIRVAPIRAGEVSVEYPACMEKETHISYYHDHVTVTETSNYN